MGSPTTRATSSKRRGVSPETEAEREAKRVHTERYVFDEAELEDIVKYEEPTDDGDADATIAMAIDTASGGPSDDHLVSCGVPLDPAFDSLDESVRVLALSFHAFGQGDDLVHGAFRTILKRHMELNEDTPNPTIPKLSLYQWLEGLLGRLGLSAVNLDAICSALQGAELDRIVESWSSKHNTNDPLIACELLQEMQKYGDYTVADVIQRLEALAEPDEIAKAQIRHSSKVTTAEKVSRKTKASKSVSRITNAEPKARAGAAQRANGGELVLLTTKANSATLRVTSDQKPAGRDVGSATRGKSIPPAKEEKSQSEPRKNSSNLPSSSPAIVDFLTGNPGSPSRITGRSNTKRTKEPDSKIFREATPGAQIWSKLVAAPTILVRYIKAGVDNVLVFFIGRNMGDVPREEVTEVCLGAFTKQPFQTHLWSESIWVAHMNGVSGIFSNVVTVQGVQLAAIETNSDPTRHFVGFITGREVEDKILKTAVEDAVAAYHPNQASGRIIIYRTPHTQKRGNYVFLVLSKPPPKPLLPIFIPGGSDEGRYLIFKPSIMDCETPCFYCGQIHEEFICADAAQISRFVIPAKRSKPISEVCS